MQKLRERWRTVRWRQYMLCAVAVSRAKNYVAVGAMKAIEVTDNVT